MTTPIKSWADVAPRLIDVASGRAPADMVIRQGQWVNVHSREVIPNTDITIADGRFAYCGPNASAMIGPDTEVIEANGRFIVPGLCDAHMHIESGMLTTTQF
ncbi:MAG: adenine deaminase, partial [Rhodobacteraceae bacterium]|nr:adenine deaminase [Paracoccaceae bacterium]